METTAVIAHYQRNIDDIVSAHRRHAETGTLDEHQILDTARALRADMAVVNKARAVQVAQERLRIEIAKREENPGPGYIA